VLRFAEAPEMMTELYRTSPGVFVSLFGQQGFEEFLGTAAQRTSVEAIAMGDLTAQGQAALTSLESALQVMDPASVSSVFGAIQAPVVSGP